MTNASKSAQYMSWLLARSCRLDKCGKRYYSARLKEFDRESYLNKKIMKGHIPFTGYCTGLIPLTCFGLALWQVHRLKWKNELIRVLEERSKLPAIELPEDLTDRKKLEYRKVRVRGTFDHSREMYIRPRSKIVDDQFAESLPFLMPSFGTEPEKSNIGLIVVTPFKVADRDVEILVNRGWVLNDQRNPKSRLDGQIEGEVELEGIIRLKEEKPSHIEENRKHKIFSHRDIEAMAEMAGTTHFYIDATAESSIPGGPLGGQTQINVHNNHKGYIVTWTILGCYTGWMWHKRWVRKLH